MRPHPDDWHAVMAYDMIRKVVVKVSVLIGCNKWDRPEIYLFTPLLLGSIS